MLNTADENNSAQSSNNQGGAWILCEYHWSKYPRDINVAGCNDNLKLKL